MWQWIKHVISTIIVNTSCTKSQVVVDTSCILSATFTVVFIHWLTLFCWNFLSHSVEISYRFQLSPMAKSANIILFDDLHKYCVLNLMCKIHLKLCGVTLSGMFKKINVSHNYYTRNACNKFYIQPCRTNVRKLFISNYGAVVWNNLNDAMFTCTLKSFKLLSKSNILSSYI